jgi:hypothetical protein
VPQRVGSAARLKPRPDRLLEVACQVPVGAVEELLERLWQYPRTALGA